jgi:transcriptional regulator with XRE-family HTH domain
MRTDLGFELKIERQRNKVRQLDITRRTGISPTRISKIENGWEAAPPDIEAAIRSAIRDLASGVNDDARSIV